MKRTNSRIIAMMKLFDYDFNKQIDQSLEEMLELDGIEYDNEYCNTLFDGVVSNLDAIDKIINRNIINYSLSRLNNVDKALLRIGVFELVYLKEPSSIVINEIVELSKVYSQTDDYLSSKFNNSLLDKVAKGECNE